VNLIFICCHFVSFFSTGYGTDTESHLMTVSRIILSRHRSTVFVCHRSTVTVSPCILMMTESLHTMLSRLMNVSDLTMYSVCTSGTVTTFGEHPHNSRTISTPITNTATHHKGMRLTS
jgi:hypothetical protein